MQEVTARLLLKGDKSTQMKTIRSLAKLGVQLLGFNHDGTVVIVRGSYETMRSVEYHVIKSNVR